MRQRTVGRAILWGLSYGLFMTVTGWLGNNLLLGVDWDRASQLAANQVVLPYPGIVREIISLVFDFLHMVLLFWIFSRFQDRSFGSALKLTLVFYFATLVIMYLAIVNSRLLPWEVSLKTTLLGLVLALPAAWILPRVFPMSGENVKSRSGDRND